MKPLLLLVVSISVITANAQLLIRNTSIVDVENKKILPQQNVLIQNGIITDISKNIKAPSGTTVVHGSGKWLMPGLVDAHVHFSQSGGIYTRPDAIDLRRNRRYEDEVRWTHQNMEGLLRRYARAGITSVVDVGSTVNFLTQRDSFRSKVELIAWCRRRKLPVIVCGSAGGRIDATQVRVRDLSRTEHDAMLALIRRKLRAEFNFPKNSSRYFGVPAVYSLENVRYPQADGTVCGLRPPSGGDSAALKLALGMNQRSRSKSPAGR